MYIAPFYHDSATQFEQNIELMVSKATKRIIVCAQHICAYNYTYNNAYTSSSAKPDIIQKKGFLDAVLQKAREGLNIQFLSQTYVDEKNDSHGCRAPLNKNSFVKFIAAAKKWDATIMLIKIFIANLLLLMIM